MRFPVCRCGLLVADLQGREKAPLRAPSRTLRAVMPLLHRPCVCCQTLAKTCLVACEPDQPSVAAIDGSTPLAENAPRRWPWAVRGGADTLVSLEEGRGVGRHSSDDKLGVLGPTERADGGGPPLAKGKRFERLDASCMEHLRCFVMVQRVHSF